VINAILAMRILIQFVGQAVGHYTFKQKRRKKILKWKMPFYPLPVILAIIMWLLVFISTSLSMAGTGVLVISLGIIVYLLKARLNKEWPFES
jgi:protein-S-isoprenylcysteine O-methyltransferase Ste14